MESRPSKPDEQVSTSASMTETGRKQQPPRISLNPRKIPNQTYCGKALAYIAVQPSRSREGSTRTNAEARIGDRIAHLDSATLEQADHQVKGHPDICPPRHQGARDCSQNCSQGLRLRSGSRSCIVGPGVAPSGGSRRTGGRARSTIVDTGKRITRLQGKHYLPACVTTFEARGGLNAHRVFISNADIAKCLQRSAFGQIIKLAPVPPAGFSPASSIIRSIA
jgi:hypothetical protein